MSADATAPMIVDPCDDPRWRSLAVAAGSLFESPPWLRAVRDAFGVVPSAALVGPEHGLTPAGLVVGRIDDALGARQSTFPFSDYCDPISLTDELPWATLSEHLLDPATPYSIRTRRERLFSSDDAFVETARFAWHTVALGDDLDALWDGLAGGARQNIRRSRASGLHLSSSSTRLALERFHALHVDVRRRKYAMLAQPREYFDALHDQFAPNELAVLTAEVDGTACASIVLLRWGHTAYYKFNASSPAANPVRANDALMWFAIEYARDVWGCQALDLGLSDLDQPGLLRYKSKYASAVGDIVGYRAVSPLPDPASTKMRSVIHQMTAVLTAEDVPTEALLRSSSVLYRHFS